MSRRCKICGKKGLYGSRISHSHRVTKRRQFPNLHKVKVKVGDGIKAILICTKCLKLGKVEKVVSIPKE
jgi:large subunit ribosomal protein L28